MDEKKLSQKNADTVISLSSLTDTEIQVDRGRTEGGAIQGGGEQEVQTGRDKVSHKSIVYNTGDTASILQKL